MMIMARYRDALANIPPPGCGCHGALLSVANRGTLAKIDPQQMFADIRQAIPPGTRHIPDKEILDAIRKALADHHGGSFTPQPRPRPVVQDGKAALQRIIGQATIRDEVDLWESSPRRVWGEPQDDTVLLLETLYRPTERLFIGERHDAGILGSTIRTAGEWLAYFRDGGQTAPHIIPNPVDGIPRPKKTGDSPTLRGDANIQTFRFCVIEFDNIPQDEQFRFWTTIRLPLVALIASGGKSVHGWVDVQKLTTVETPAAWERDIKGRLYSRLLTPIGVDPACSNCARLSRLPGHFRADKQAYQRLLWLSSEGRGV